MARRSQFPEDERKRLCSQLEEPFHPSAIKWRVVRSSYDHHQGAVLPFADPRAYSDRLNKLFTPSGWKKEYAISHVSSLVRMDRGKPTVTSKVLVASAVTIHGFGSQCGTGEEWADRENAVTGADAQAFKRACSAFGLGRYLYQFKETWVSLDPRGEPMKVPLLPPWALPRGVVAVAVRDGVPVEVQGPTDPNLTAEIEGLREALGEAIFLEILSRAGHSREAQNIPNAELQKDTLKWMRAADRGLQRIHNLAHKAGQQRFMPIVERLSIDSIATVPSLEVLKRLVDELESLGKKRAA